MIELNEYNQKELFKYHILAVKEIIEYELEMLKSETKKPFEDKELMKKAITINRDKYIKFIEKISRKKWSDL